MARLRKFSIDGDLLSVLSFVVRHSGPQVGQDGSIHTLREIHDQLNPRHVEGHIVHMAFEVLGYNRVLILCAWVAGAASLTPEFERELRDKGWLYGKEPKLPKAVVDRCKFLNKHVYYDNHWF